MKLGMFLLVLMPLSVAGQHIEKLTGNTKIASARIDLAAGRLSEGVSADSIQLTLQNGELLIQYQLPELEEEGRYYSVTPRIMLDGRDLLVFPHEEFRGDWGEPLLPGLRQLEWIDLPQRYIQLQGALEVVLSIERWGERKLPYDCSLGEPQFTGKQRLPYYLAAGLGVASIGAGQLLRKQSQRIYDKDYTTAETQEAASPHYKNANGKHHAHLILTYAGAGIVIADAALYLIRQGKYKKHRKLYQQYCGSTSQTFELTPEVFSVAWPAGFGMKMSWRFNLGK